MLYACLQYLGLVEEIQRLADVDEHLRAAISGDDISSRRINASIVAHNIFGRIGACHFYEIVACFDKHFILHRSSAYLSRVSTNKHVYERIVITVQQWHELIVVTRGAL